MVNVLGDNTSTSVSTLGRLVMLFWCWKGCWAMKKLCEEIPVKESVI